MSDFREGKLKAVVSDLVAFEIGAAHEAIRLVYAELLTYEPEFLSTTEESVELAQAYQREQILTPKYYSDGLHIALATVARVDVLVSWNFKHIVHYNKIRSFNSVNLRLGYQPLQIYSPREVTHYGFGNN